MKKDRTAIVIFGLALLYASAFFLPQIGSYWYRYVGEQVLYPTVFAVLATCLGAAWFRFSYRETRAWRTLASLAISALLWIAMIGIFSAAGRSATGVAISVMARDSSVEATRWLRIALVALLVPILFTSVWLARRHWNRLLRLLSTVGYAFAMLAVIRILLYEDASTFLLAPMTRAAPVTAVPSTPQVAAGIEGHRRRQVVWIIMDELDYDQTLGTPANDRTPPMPNLARLASLGASATEAYSPAKDTIASIPALLTGYDLQGLDFENIKLFLKTRDAGRRLFQESDSIFGRLPYGPGSAAILGYYQPYCTLFPSVNPCVSEADANVGRWFDALTFFSQPIVAASRWLPDSALYLPGGLFEMFEPMYRISEHTLKAFPRFLAIDDKALVYMHINLPHAPGDYSQRVLGLHRAADDRDSYRHNLVIVDELIGQTITALRQRAAREDILLVLSADHWHRIDSPLVPRRIPWIAWHVGDAPDRPITTRINSVHTEALILDFLGGRINNQDQLAGWWKQQAVAPTLMPHGLDY